MTYSTLSAREVALRDEGMVSAPVTRRGLETRFVFNPADGFWEVTEKTGRSVRKELAEVPDNLVWTAI